jgi:lipoprotein-anchoring transpeptidase ErfK/SrfK
MGKASNGRRIRILGRFLTCAAMAALLFEASPAFLGTGDAATAAPARAAPPAPAASLAAVPVPQAASAPAEATVAGNGFPDIQVHTELPIHQWLKPGEFAWNDEGVPAGPTTIVVNIRARVLSAYRAGFEIGRSSIVYGTDSKPTPIGTFPILEKDADHVSRTYGGAPMPHMLRLTRDGVAIHGSEIADDLATHGCIGLPKEFAALLFQAAHVGDRVVIWQGDSLPDAASPEDGRT